MRLLVLGGTAWLGGEIVAAAIASGHEVTCLARGESGRTPAGARFISADRDEPDAYAEVVPSTSEPRPNRANASSIVTPCASEPSASEPSTIEPSPERWDAVIDLSRSLDQVRAATQTLEPHADAYLFVSSTSAYASQSERNADEDAATFPDPDPSTPAADVPYGVAKAASERAVVEAFGATRSAIIRPGLIGGPGDPTGRSTYWPRRFAHAAAAAASSVGAATAAAAADTSAAAANTAAAAPSATAGTPAPKSPRTPRGGATTPNDAQRPVLVPAVADLPTALIDVRDLAAFIVTVIERGIQGIFNASSPALPFSEHLAIARRVAHHAGPVVEADEHWLLAEGVSPWAGPRSLPLWIDDRDWWGMNDRDVSRALAAGMRPRPLADTLAAILSAERAANSQQTASDAGGLADAPRRTAAATGAGAQTGLSDADEEHLLTAWMSR